VKTIPLNNYFQELILAHDEGKDANLNKVKRKFASKYQLGNLKLIQILKFIYIIILN